MIFVGAEHGDNNSYQDQQQNQNYHSQQPNQAQIHQPQEQHHHHQQTIAVTSAPLQQSNQGPDFTYDYDHVLPSQNNIQHTIDLTRSSSKRPSYSSRKPVYKSRPPKTVLSYGK